MQEALMKAAHFERITLDLALVSVLVCLFLPLILVAYFCAFEDIRGTERPSAEVTVGLAVIVRAAARRFLRAGVQNLLRTSVGTFVRASTRTMTRRMVRMSLGLLSKQALEDATAADGPTRQSMTRSLTAAVVGYLALCLSFRGVSRLVGPEAPSPIGSLPLTTACLIAGAPLLVYTLLMFLAAHWVGVRLRINTAIDGLLIQGYFTGAGSFLPMTTDFDYDGTPRERCWQACIGLLGFVRLSPGPAPAGRNPEPGVDAVHRGHLSGVLFRLCLPDPADPGIRHLGGKQVAMAGDLRSHTAVLPAIATREPGVHSVTYSHRHRYDRGPIDE
jgi:hypothetical protein